MEKINVRPKWTDIIPGYGAINYLWRTEYGFDEKPSMGQRLEIAGLTLTQLVYNSVVGVELLNLLEGKPSFTAKLLEKILQ